MLTVRGSTLSAVIRTTAVASGRFSYCLRARSSSVAVALRFSGVRSRLFAMRFDIVRDHLDTVHIVGIEFGIVRANAKLFFQEQRQLDQGKRIDDATRDQFVIIAELILGVTNQRVHDIVTDGVTSVYSFHRGYQLR